MKKAAILTFAAGLMALASCLPAPAQEVLKVTFTTTFSFYAGGAKLPPGTYTVTQSQEDHAVYLIQNSSGSHQVMVEGQPSSKSTNGSAQIGFNKYGTTECLESIVTLAGHSVDIDTGIPEKLAAKKGSPQSHSVPAK